MRRPQDYVPVAGKCRSGRRNPLTAEYLDYTQDEVEFMMAMDRYKADNHRPFPTCSEVLAVLVSLGYRKSAEKTEPPVWLKGSSRHRGLGAERGGDA